MIWSIEKFDGDGGRIVDEHSVILVYRDCSQIEAVEQIVEEHNRLAACEVQRDAALAACEAFMGRYQNKFADARLLFYDVAQKCLNALAMTPDDTANVIEERDRLRDLLETAIGISPYGTEWHAFLQEARQALAPKGEPDAST